MHRFTMCDMSATWSSLALQRFQEEAEKLQAAIERLKEKAESTQAELRAAQEALAAANAMAKSQEAAAGEQGATMAATIAQLQQQLESERLKACSLLIQSYFGCIIFPPKAIMDTRAWDADLLSWNGS
jgi:predicted  nucleic acid-binding Zn-ribbon protein